MESWGKHLLAVYQPWSNEDILQEIEHWKDKIEYTDAYDSVSKYRSKLDELRLVQYFRTEEEKENG
jgi:hypothetical protein